MAISVFQFMALRVLSRTHQLSTSLRRIDAFSLVIIGTLGRTSSIIFPSTNWFISCVGQTGWLFFVAVHTAYSATGKPSQHCQFVTLLESWLKALHQSSYKTKAHRAISETKSSSSAINSTLGLVWHTVSFRARNDRNNKRYNKRPRFISGRKLLLTKSTHNSLEMGMNPGLLLHLL